MDINKDASDLRESTRELFRNLSLLDRDRASCCGITVAQCHAITETGRLGRVAPSVLAEILRLDRSTVTRLVDNLEAQGFLTREQDPLDRRSILLALTEKGEEFFQATEETMDRFYASIVEKIPVGDRKALLSGIRVISESFSSEECKCFRRDNPDEGRGKEINNG